MLVLPCNAFASLAHLAHLAHVSVASQSRPPVLLLSTCCTAVSTSENTCFRSRKGSSLRLLRRHVTSRMRATRRRQLLSRQARGYDFAVIHLLLNPITNLRDEAAAAAAICTRTITHPRPALCTSACRWCRWCRWCRFFPCCRSCSCRRCGGRRRRGRRGRASLRSEFKE